MLEKKIKKKLFFFFFGKKKKNKKEAFFFFFGKKKENRTISTGETCSFSQYFKLTAAIFLKLNAKKYIISFNVNIIKIFFIKSDSAKFLSRG